MASRGRVSWEQIEVMAQSAAVLRHLLAAVELCARGVAFTLLDKCIHLHKHISHVHVTGPLREHLSEGLNVPGTPFGVSHGGSPSEAGVATDHV